MGEIMDVGNRQTAIAGTKKVSSPFPTVICSSLDELLVESGLPASWFGATAPTALFQVGRNAKMNSNSLAHVIFRS